MANHSLQSSLISKCHKYKYGNKYLVSRSIVTTREGISTTPLIKKLTNLSPAKWDDASVNPKYVDVTTILNKQM